ncbi:MAG: hypothetical protein PHE82_09600 [Syntrophomonadaceae bacterium]|nr:hypothetical protein [Syntrophomonadaceae bacterium]
MSEQEVARLQEQIKTLFAGQGRIEKNQNEFEAETRNTVNDIYKEIKALKDQFANRLPLWATTLIGILTGLCGFLAARAF